VIPRNIDGIKNLIKILLLLLFVVLLNTSCNKKKQTKQPISLTASKKITAFNDTTFFTGTEMMLFADNNSLYIADDINKIYRLGLHLNLIASMGRKGKGPGEFTGISDIGFANDSLYVYDREQAKIVVYDGNNRFAREIGISDNSGYNIVVDNQGHIFLSTPDRNHLITEFDAHGHKIRSFGQNTVAKNSHHFLRNKRILFIHKKKLIAVAPSEPVVTVYRLDGTSLHKTEINPPHIQKLTERVKKGNKKPLKSPYFNSVSLIFVSAAMYKSKLYLMEAMHTKKNTNTWPHKFTYVFKYQLKPNGGLTFKRTFKLFRHNHHKLLYGFRLAAMKKHKLLVYDLQSGALVEFKDKHL
jgi:hypothetical protein